MLRVCTSLFTGRLEYPTTYDHPAQEGVMPENSSVRKIHQLPSAPQPKAAQLRIPEKVFDLNREARSGREVLRFLKSERVLHWAVAVPFIVCWVSALVLVLVYNPDPLRPYRQFFSLTHRISGICLIVSPVLALLFGLKERKTHLDNIKTALSWSLNDLKWLALMIPASVSRKIVLPEQGKFNAAEKVNFIMVMLSIPLLISSGVLVWMGHWAWLAWLVHALTAVIATPTMLGHMYMAMVNPETRKGIKGMITGYVDRQWAKHHYGAWYRERFARTHERDKIETLNQERHILLKCPKCSMELAVRWSWLVPRVMNGAGMICPGCTEPFSVAEGLPDLQKQERSHFLHKDETAVHTPPEAPEAAV
jgi:formate dehydrogenase subunit gamma